MFTMGMNSLSTMAEDFGEGTNARARNLMLVPRTRDSRHNYASVVMARDVTDDRDPIS